MLDKIPSQISSQSGVCTGHGVSQDVNPIAADEIHKTPVNIGQSRDLSGVVTVGHEVGKTCARQESNLQPSDS